MKYGVREICDVVLKAKGKMRIGNKIFYKDEPVLYFDSLKTSTMEGAATTVYAQGGRGNSRLIAWEGERTVTFTMEDALLSTASLAVLTGADVISASADTGTFIVQHITEINKISDGAGQIILKKDPYIPDDRSSETFIYVMKLDDEGNIVSEPYLYTAGSGFTARMKDSSHSYAATKLPVNTPVLVDYYTKVESKATQIEITPDKFGGNFYLEASTLFRDTNGNDLPAEFIIPNCKVQSNFNFTMASSGDPSTFTFTMDAFPDNTRWDSTKKVLSVIQIIEDESGDNYKRVRTSALPTHDNGTDKIGASIDTEIYALISAINALNYTDLQYSADTESDAYKQYDAFVDDYEEVVADYNDLTYARQQKVPNREYLDSAYSKITTLNKDAKPTAVNHKTASSNS